MSKTWNGLKTPSFEIFHEGTDKKGEDCFGTFKKLVINTEHSNSDNYKKPSVLAQILSFL